METKEEIETRIKRLEADMLTETSLEFNPSIRGIIVMEKLRLLWAILGEDIVGRYSWTIND